MNWLASENPLNELQAGSVQIHEDEATGCKYSYDPETGETNWLDEDGSRAVQRVGLKAEVEEGFVGEIKAGEDEEILVAP